jgi:GTPase-associated protein 1, N-terminal domain type 2/GTPase-associated protein 1, middle domain
VPPVVPELASRADVDALPRRLRLDVVGDLACLSHVVAAGSDYSGRPNFFAHGLLVEPVGGQADDDGFLRPADLWGAALWLQPFGADEVEGTELEPDPLELERGTLDEAALSDFMRRHPNQRAMVFAAVERLLVDHGGPVVVVGDDPESVAQWMRLVGRFLLPATAWRLPFSTYERARDLSTPTAAPFAVVGVPAADAVVVTGLPGSHFAVLRDGEPPVRAGVNRWTLPDGCELTAGSWARLAESVVALGLMPAVAELVDELADDFGSSAVEEPLWALGAAVLLLDELPEEDLAGDAAALVQAHWPRTLDGDASTIRELLGLLADHADCGTVAAAVSRRDGDASPSLTEQLVRVETLRHVFSGPAQYLRTGYATTPDLPDLSPGVQVELDGLLSPALDWVAGAGVIAPRALLDIASLLTAGSACAGRVTALAASLLIPRLLDRYLDPQALGWPPIPEWLWRRLRPALAEALATGNHDPGLAFSNATNEWLGPLGLVRGELRSASLRLTGPVEWERSAHTLFRRHRPVTEMERAAAYLAAFHGDDLPRPDGRCWRASQDAYPGELLDLRQAIVLMENLPTDARFAEVLLEVLRRTAPSPESIKAIQSLRSRERLLPAHEAMVVQHLSSPVTDASGAL